MEPRDAANDARENVPTLQAQLFAPPQAFTPGLIACTKNVERSMVLGDRAAIATIDATVMRG